MREGRGTGVSTVRKKSTKLGCDWAVDLRELGVEEAAAQRAQQQRCQLPGSAPLNLPLRHLQCGRQVENSTRLPTFSDPAVYYATALAQSVLGGAARWPPIIMR